MAIEAAEISAILKDQIKNFGQEAEVAEVGRVLSVGDGIARVFGLDNVQAGEMVEFPGGIQGHGPEPWKRTTLVLLSSVPTGTLKKATLSSAPSPLCPCLWVTELLGRVVDGLGNPIGRQRPDQRPKSAALADAKSAGHHPA